MAEKNQMNYKCSPPPFDFVLEIYTLQVLSPELREAAMDRIVDCVRADGTLLVISRGWDEPDDPGQMPWPLLKAELRHFESCGLMEVSSEDYFDDEQPPVRRLRIEYRRETE